MHTSDSMVLVIFGATGDLAQNKIFPSLFHLYTRSLLPSSFTIIGTSRRKYDDDAFRAFLLSDVFVASEYNEKTVKEFLSHVVFSSGDFDDSNTYKEVEKRINDIEHTTSVCSNKLFYLSTSPGFYRTILSHISDSDITSACGKNEWARILIEKPFGEDIETAQALDELLGTLFDEEQIFRIDHYLAKEAVQNLVIFRLANTLFEPAWNKDHIESISIHMYETARVDTRGTFYDAFGALRDVGQNHILQMFALTAMEPCAHLSADELRTRKAEALLSLKTRTCDTINQVLVRGQYEGYRETYGVDDASDTETYFSVVAYSELPRWEGVPFYLTSGKALSEDCAEIVVRFHDERSCSFLTNEYDDKGNNILTFRIKPEEMMSLSLWLGKPGSQRDAFSRLFTFKYKDLDGHDTMHMDAYEKVLLDCIAGDHTVFPSTDEVMAAWRYISSLRTCLDNVPLRIYSPGSTGPSLRK